jgi:hypothetical protein
VFFDAHSSALSSVFLAKELRGNEPDLPLSTSGNHRTAEQKGISMIATKTAANSSRRRTALRHAGLVRWQRDAR